MLEILAGKAMQEERHRGASQAECTESRDSSCTWDRLENSNREQQRDTSEDTHTVSNV
jgi:hypothetical protein